MHLNNSFIAGTDRGILETNQSTGMERLFCNPVKRALSADLCNASLKAILLAAGKSLLLKTGSDTSSRSLSLAVSSLKSMQLHLSLTALSIYKAAVPRENNYSGLQRVSGKS